MVRNTIEDVNNLLVAQYYVKAVIAGIRLRLKIKELEKQNEQTRSN